MTAAKATTRRRRTGSGASVPREAAAWFAGELPAHAIPWRVRAFPGYVLVSDWWLAWQAEHPRATPPAGSEWLADPDHPRHHRRGPGFNVARRQPSGQGA